LIPRRRGGGDPPGKGFHAARTDGQRERRTGRDGQTERGRERERERERGKEKEKEKRCMKMCRCEDVKMYSRPPLLEQPFAQMLSGIVIGFLKGLVPMNNV
jgi:hypothetical protein